MAPVSPLPHPIAPRTPTSAAPQKTCLNFIVSCISSTQKLPIQPVDDSILAYCLARINLRSAITAVQRSRTTDTTIAIPIIIHS